MGYDAWGSQFISLLSVAYRLRTEGVQDVFDQYGSLATFRSPLVAS